ncbi:MAG: DUF4270 family protein [Saprospiraceae bacterium]|nr:DUF4270 family protein [Saprospiraceae bacterium]
MKQFLTAAGLILALALFSCSKPTIVGSDLLDQDQLDLGFSDTMSLIGYTVLTDSVRTYAPDFNDQLIAYLVGQMQDPVFGQSLARVNAEFRPGTEEPDFANAVLDSVVLALPYYAFSRYGDSTEFYGIDVRLLSERMDREEIIYSNQVYQTGDLIGSSALFKPRSGDSITIQVHGGDIDETTKLPPQLRIRMDDSFGADLLSQPIEVFEDDSLFLDVFPGIQLAPNTINAGMNAFNLRTSSANAGFFVYYHVDEDYSTYQFQFNSLSARMTSFEHDYTGSVVESFIDDKEKGDSLIFLQGMSGASFIIEIPNAAFFADKVINRAELELSAITLPEDLFSPFTPVLQLIASEVTDTGLAIIDDVAFGLDQGSLEELFGGVYTDSENPPKFHLNLSAQLRKMSLGQASNKIQVTVLARPELATRIVLSGPGNSFNPAILKVNFTNL